MKEENKLLYSVRLEKAANLYEPLVIGDEEYRTEYHQVNVLNIDELTGCKELLNQAKEKILDFQESDFRGPRFLEAGMFANGSIKVAHRWY